MAMCAPGHQIPASCPTLVDIFPLRNCVAREGRAHAYIGRLLIPRREGRILVFRVLIIRESGSK